MLLIYLYYTNMLNLICKNLKIFTLSLIKIKYILCFFQVYFIKNIHILYQTKFKYHYFCNIMNEFIIIIKYTAIKDISYKVNSSFMFKLTYLLCITLLTNITKCCFVVHYVVFF